MIPILNMAGCICMGDATDWQDVESLCEECARPLGKCGWLMYSRPYAGSRYYTRVTAQYMAYVMVDCPKYEAPALTGESLEGG